MDSRFLRRNDRREESDFINNCRGSGHTFAYGAKASRSPWSCRFDMDISQSGTAKARVGITSIVIDRWTAETFWGDRSNILAVRNYKRKYSRLAEVCRLYKSSTDYNNEN
ncbi:hypothetical protein TNCV_1721221 [Trichonephila clavipes]|nr:hypothetical protein TNCV_1721221 [Trichonephila clavipes]